MVGCRRPSSTGWPGSVTSMASPSLLESSCCLSASSLSESAPSSRVLRPVRRRPRLPSLLHRQRAYSPQQLGQRPLPPEIRRRATSPSASGSANGSSSERALEVSSSTCCIMTHLKVKRVSEAGPFASRRMEHSPLENRGQLYGRTRRGVKCYALPTLSSCPRLPPSPLP